MMGLGLNESCLGTQFLEHKPYQVREQLVNIQQVSSTRGAFAALTADGDVVVWGNRRLGDRELLP